MNREHLNTLHELQDTEYVMKWYGWGSPIGLTVFFIGIAVFVILIRFAFLMK